MKLEVDKLYIQNVNTRIEFQHDHIRQSLFEIGDYVQKGKTMTLTMDGRTQYHAIGNNRGLDVMLELKTDNDTEIKTLKSFFDRWRLNERSRDSNHLKITIEVVSDHII